MCQETNTSPGTKKTPLEKGPGEDLIIQKIVSIKEKLILFKEKEIANDIFLKASDEDKKNTRLKFKEIYQEYDKLNKTEDEMSTTGLRSERCLYESMQTLALINRITNKIQREEAKIINEKSERVSRDSADVINNIKKIEIENTKLKDSIITVSSLVFMSFTFIQLNFVAFQRSSDYGVLDRIILFSGINTFVIVGIYSIILMINSLLSGEIIKEKHDYIQKRLGCVFIFFILMYLGTLYVKNRKDEHPEVATLRMALIAKNEEIKELNKLRESLYLTTENIAVLNNKLKLKMKKTNEEFNKMEKINKEYLIKIQKKQKEINNILNKKAD